MNLLNNNKGFTILVIPLTIAIIGILGTGVFASIDYEKGAVLKRDSLRKIHILAIQDKLTDYYSEYQNYPFNPDEAKNGQKVLLDALNNIPQDPLNNKGKSYWYWSNGSVYTLRYFTEATNEETVVFSK